MNDLMLDLETLGTRPTSVIVQIGACYFDRYTGEIGNTFCENINVADCLLKGLTIDQSTIDWWKTQFRQEWVDEHLSSLYATLERFTKFSKQAKFVWSHTTFDIPILMYAYSTMERLKPGFHYRASRDIRTLVDLSGIEYKVDKDAVTHNALEDCIRQVEYCVKCFNKLKG